MCVLLVTVSLVLNILKLTEVLLSVGVFFKKTLFVPSLKGTQKRPKLFLFPLRVVFACIFDIFILVLVCIKPFQDSIQLARILINYGADVNQRSANQWTSLHYCVKYGKLNLALVLLDHGANPLLADDLKEAPLDLMNGNRNDLLHNSNEYNLLLRRLAYAKAK